MLYLRPTWQEAALGHWQVHVQLLFVWQSSFQHAQTDSLHAAKFSQVDIYFYKGRCSYQLSNWPVREITSTSTSPFFINSVKKKIKKIQITLFKGCNIHSQKNCVRLCEFGKKNLGFWLPMFMLELEQVIAQTNPINISNLHNHISCETIHHAVRRIKCRGFNRYYWN